jgi:hypothetical protein
MKKYDFWGAPNTAELIPADSITLFILVSLLLSSSLCRMPMSGEPETESIRKRAEYPHVRSCQRICRKAIDNIEIL